MGRSKLQSENIKAFTVYESGLGVDPESALHITSDVIVGWSVRQVHKLHGLVTAFVGTARSKHDSSAWSEFHNWNEAHRLRRKAVPNALNNPRQGWEYLTVLQLVLDLTLDSLGNLKGLQQRNLRLQCSELLALVLLKSFLVHLTTIPDCEELEILKEVIVRFERSEANIEPCRCACLYGLTFGIDLEDCHVLSVIVLPFLQNPADVELTIHAVCELNLLLATDSHVLTIAKVKEIFAQLNKSVLAWLKEQLLMQSELVLLKDCLRHLKLVSC